MFKFQYEGGKKRKSEKKFWVTKRGITGLQIGARGITNRDSFRDFKSGQKDDKSGQRLPIGAREISICSRY